MPPPLHTSLAQSKCSPTFTIPLLHPPKYISMHTNTRALLLFEIRTLPAARRESCHATRNAPVCRSFMTGYLPVGYELAIELTYPVPEGTSSGLLNGGTQLIGFVLTTVYSWVFSTAGDVAANMMVAGLLTVGLLLTAFIPADLKRQAAHKAIDDGQKSRA